MQSEVLLRPRQLAVLLGVTRERVYQLLRAREIPSTRVGGAIRVPTAAWKQWLADKATEAMHSTQKVDQ